MHRRAFLSSLGCTAALTAAASPVFARGPALIPARHHRFNLIAEPELEQHARGLAHRLSIASAGRIELRVASQAGTSRDARQHPDENGMRLGTLQTEVQRHPAFGYAAGLPGQLGLPLDFRTAWLTGSGHTLWHELQCESGVVCLPTNIATPAPRLWSHAAVRDWTALRGQTLNASGLALEVACGLGARAATETDASLIHRRPAIGLPSGYRFSTAPALQRAPDLIALKMQPTVWTGLDASCQQALRAVAFSAGWGLSAPDPRPPAGTHAVLPDGIVTAIGRVSEAVVAALPAHDRLSQRINASYFAVRAATAGRGAARLV